jgi:hypothetical protein
VLTADLEGERGTNSIPGTAAWSVVAPTVLPAGLTLNADTGVISGTPPTGLTKDYTFRIKLVDSAGLIAEKTFTLPVIKAGVNKTTLNLPVELAGGTLITDEVFDLNGDVPLTQPLQRLRLLVMLMLTKCFTSSVLVFVVWLRPVVLRQRRPFLQLLRVSPFRSVHRF